MCNEKQKRSNIKVCLVDTVLTPKTCSCLVNEILKCLLYQKSQIPYPYTWLRTAITKKRTTSDPPKPQNFTIQKHYQTASKIYDSLQETMKNIQLELTQSNVEEIVIIFGPLIFTPKEIFTIKIPPLNQGFDDGKQQSYLQKNQQILREIFVTEEWLSAMETTISCTNTFLLIKKDGSCRNDFFTNCSNFAVPENVCNTVIELTYPDEVSYQDSKIFEDDGGVLSEGTESPSRWFQGKGCMKGFKDCFLNKTSVSELW